MKAAKLKKGSSNPKMERVGKISRSKIKEIAELKMPDLNAFDIDGAMKIIEGTASVITSYSIHYTKLYDL